MNALLLSALALVSAEDFFELPIFRKSSNVTIKASGNSKGVTFNRESLFTNMIINSDTYETHLEPEFGDLWVFEDENRASDAPHAPTEENLQRLGLKQDYGMYYIADIKVKNSNPHLPYAVINRAMAMDNSRTGGLGLGPKNSKTFTFPTATDFNRDSYPNFAGLIKNRWAKSDAFTINLAAYPWAEDYLVFGAMDVSRFNGKLKALQKSPSTGLITADFTINGAQTSASLDIEDPNSYLEERVVMDLARSLGAQWDDRHNLYAISAKPQDDLVLNFNGLEIKVPSDDLWVQDKEVDEKWYFTIRPVTDFAQKPKTPTLGADILKSAYIVYDLGHDRAAIGEANRKPGPSNFEVIPAEGIPEKYFS